MGARVCPPRPVARAPHSGTPGTDWAGRVRAVRCPGTAGATPSAQPGREHARWHGGAEGWRGGGAAGPLGGGVDSLPLPRSTMWSQRMIWLNALACCKITVQHFEVIEVSGRTVAVYP